MTCPHTKEYALSSGLIHQAIFALQLEKNTSVYAQGATKTEYGYPGWNKFSDEGGKAIKGDLIYYIVPDEKAATRYDWFAPKTSAGLT